jgi:hypothetical protein
MFHIFLVLSFLTMKILFRAWSDGRNMRSEHQRLAVESPMEHEALVVVWA